MAVLRGGGDVSGDGEGSSQALLDDRLISRCMPLSVESGELTSVTSLPLHFTRLIICTPFCRLCSLSRAHAYG